MAAPPGTPQSPGAQRPSIGPDDIFEAATVCRHRFEEYLQSLRLYREQVAELQRQFLTWASFLGVFAPVNICLDTRLADAPEIKELIISMLTVLKRNLERGTKRHREVGEHEIDAGEANPENDGAMIGITGSVDRLSRLALIIRASSKPESIERVLKFSRKREPDGFDDVIFALVKWRFAAPIVAESLRIQLASSIIYRRNRLLYRLRREMNFGADRNSDAVSETTLTEFPGKAGRAAIADAMERPQDGQRTQALHLATKAAAAPSTLLRQVQMQSVGDGKKGLRIESDASSVRSNNPFAPAEYPRAPKVPVGRSDAKCTICSKPQSREILEHEKKWKGHVEEDLQPYVCISEQCGNLPPAFSTREDWRNHMRDEHRPDWARRIHRPSRWLCPLPHGETYSCDTEKLLLGHLTVEHPDIPDVQKTLIASRSKVLIPLESYTCPFCGDAVTLVSGAKAAEGSQTASKSTATREDLESRTGDPESLGGKGLASPTADKGPSPPSTVSHDTTSSLAGQKEGALAIRMWKHIADHLESLAFWSLRWWDDDSGASAETGKDGQLTSQGPEHAMSDRPQVIDEPTDLEEAVFFSSVRSQFPSPGQKFLPINIMQDLITLDTVLEKLPDLLDSQEGAELASYILQNAKRVFAITAVHCGLDQEKLKIAMAQFMKVEFGDDDLPIPDEMLPKVANVYLNAFAASPPLTWTRARITDFYISQWRYLAPVFSKDFFRYTFGPNHVMPFIWINDIVREGPYSRVHEAHIHKAHHMDIADAGNAAPFTVALKESMAHANDGQARDVWKRESEMARISEMAQIIRELDHPHIIKPLAWISIGHRDLLMLQWANGGTLREYWLRRSTPQLSESLVVDVLRQLQGLADALCVLHGINLRHGNLKPEKILRIPNSSDLGRLVLAGIGDTAPGPTTTKLTTRLHEPPEISTGVGARSRAADIWSMGCIFLEFLIWMLYGLGELQRFHYRLSSDSSFFETTPDSKGVRTTVHKMVYAWMDAMAEDPECDETTALGNLLQLTRGHMLLVTVPNRITALKLRDELRDILDRRGLVNYSGRSRAGLRPPSATIWDPPSRSFGTHDQLFNDRKLGIGAEDGRKLMAEDFLQSAEQFYAQHIKGLSSARNIRIAILDTGIDKYESFFRTIRRSRRARDDPIKDARSFVGEPEEDTFGHGTNVAALVLKMAPEADLYIAKIAHGQEVDGADQIAKAITWARAYHRVDIINMSFGLARNHDAVEAAIFKAEHEGVIVIAAASNYGGNKSRAFPARMDKVICVHASDGNGYPSGMDPFPHANGTNLTTLGVAIPSITSADVYLSGTSYSCPIAAGIAANILRFVQHLFDGDKLTPELRDEAFSRAGMMRVLAAMADSNGGYDYVAPWRKMWTPSSTVDDVACRIKDALKDEA